MLYWVLGFRRERGVRGIVVVLVEPSVHIYMSTMTNLEYKTRQEQILVYLVFPNNQYTQHWER